jgi:ribosomal protein S18 acetylase RimI-like enzyme
VATFKGAVIGFLGLTPPEDNQGDAPIHAIGIHRAYRGRGVASQLFRVACESLMRNDATEWISVSDQSRGSHISRLALELGFSWLRDRTYVLSLKESRYPW